MGSTKSRAHGAQPGGHSVPQPAPPPPQTQLPRPLTFFLNAKDRTAVLRALRAIDRDRACALLQALDITPSASRSSCVTGNGGTP